MNLPELLIQHRTHLLRYVERRAGPVLRYETAEDLVQAIHLHALENQAAFEYRGLQPFLAWLNEVARRFLKDRREHWSALKRRPAELFRLTHAGAEPEAQRTGPGTFADRREQVDLAVKALDMLPPRDREIVQCATQGLDDASVARRLGLEPRTAARARQRALDRFRKAYRLLRQRG